MYSPTELTYSDLVQALSGQKRGVLDDIKAVQDRMLKLDDALREVKREEKRLRLIADMALSGLNTAWCWSMDRTDGSSIEWSERHSFQTVSLNFYLELTKFEGKELYRLLARGTRRTILLEDDIMDSFRREADYDYLKRMYGYKGLEWDYGTESEARHQLVILKTKIEDDHQEIIRFEKMAAQSYLAEREANRPAIDRYRIQLQEIEPVLQEMLERYKGGSNKGNRAV